MTRIYHGFPILANSELGGFAFGTISEPIGASGGDAFVVAPNEGRWGVYSFYFSDPIVTEQDFVRQLHSILPVLKAYYSAALNRPDKRV